MSSPNAAGRFAARSRDRAQELSGFADQPHALAAPAGGRLDEQGVTDAVRNGLRRVRRGPVESGAWEHWDACALHTIPGFGLGAHRRDGFSGRPDPNEPRIDDGSREVGVLRQEAVSGMHGIGAGAAGGLYDGIPAKIRVRGTRAP